MVKLDVRGEICPYPMLRAVEALKKLKEDDTLEVLTDHPPALSTIPWEAAKMGFGAEVQQTAGAEWRITLARQASELSPSERLRAIAGEIPSSAPGL